MMLDSPSQEHDRPVLPAPIPQENRPQAPISEQIETLATQSNLTASQLLLWLGQQLDPAMPLYNMVFSFTIRGAIEPLHLQQAFQALVDRADILRLQIMTSAGIPQQQVCPKVQYNLPFWDFSGEATPAKIARQWLHQRCTRRLDLQTGLFDSALLKLGPDHFIWYINQHHLITDNWSVSLLYRQLQDYYGRSLNGTLAAAPALPSYLAYVKHEQDRPRSHTHQQAIDYWHQKRAQLPPPMPLYGQMQTSVSARTERIYCELGKARSQALRALAKTPEARSLSIHQSLFNLFLTLLFAYLYRISHQTELAIAAPAHNRPTPADKETPGIFMELFPLQVGIEPNETFRSLLAKVKRESMAFLRYAQAGISHHAMDRTINVVLSYINVTFPDFNGIPAQTEWIHAGCGDTQHHLRLEVQDFDATGNLTLQFDFNCDLIPAPQRQWAPEHFCKLLDAWLANDQQPIATVDILAIGERSRLAPPPTVTGRAPTATLVTCFQQHAKRTPDQPAVVCDQQTLTYAELETQANQLAHYLQRQGMAQGMTVGLLMQRSVRMVVSILGILKAGAAYLPIDPAYPTERTTFMVRDGQVAVLLTQQCLLNNVPDTQVPVLSLEAQQAAIAAEPTHPPDVELTGQDLAYVLFTSGSTGQPKGVMVEHGNVLAMLQGFEQTAPAGHDLRGAAVCSYGFDVSVWELFANLCFGGTVHILAADVVTSHHRLAQYLITHQITSAYIPPALLPTVIERLAKATGTIALDRILVGVEPIQQQLLQRYRQRLPQLRIVNGYGPTETTICATFYAFDTPTDPQANTPIGKAVPGYEVYVVNPQGQQVPIGVKGEIVIGGAGLSRGYLHRPELMRERFIDNPFGPGKLYKTGDQARSQLDGNLVFLGRLDDQVKIRGFRVELSEVETALNQHPQIQQAVVLAQATPQGSQALMAYLVTADAPLTSSQIRDSLQQKLPDYMVPGTFMILDALPLTPNGKVDRRRLASAEYTDRDRLGTATDYVAPTTAWETYLADVWAQYLSVESVGIHDNYFDLGGDSITAIQIAAQAAEAGLTLSPQQILQQLTIARLLTHCHPTQAHQTEPTPTPGNIPLTPIQHAFFEHTLTEPHHWNQSLLLEVTQPLDPDVLAQALQALLQHHAVLSFQFQQEASGWQQVQPDSVAPVSLRYVDLADQTNPEQDAAIATIEAELQTSLDLATGDLVRAALFQLGPHRNHQLLLVIHHLVMDGVSWLAVLNDLATFYRQAQGETVSPPLPTTPFATWATGLANVMAAGGFQTELAYWLQPPQAQLQPLPRDGVTANPEDTIVATTQHITTYLTAEATRSLLKEMPKVARVQVNEVILTALTLALGSATEPSSLLIDVESHGREEAVVSGTTLVRTVGWFTTVFPLLLTRQPEHTLGDQLQAVKEQLRNVPSNGIGYGLLRYLANDPDIRAQLQRMPQADILFNYLGDLEGLLPEHSGFRFARELRLSRSPQGQRRYWLEVNVAVVREQLQVEWSYSQPMHQPATVQGWADALMDRVRSLMAYYLAPEAAPANTYSPVDFPLASLNTQKLGKIAALLNQADTPRPDG